jgi:hypothetical protein
VEEGVRVGLTELDWEGVRVTVRDPEEQYVGLTLEVELSVGLTLGDTLRVVQVVGEGDWEGVLLPLRDPDCVGVVVREGLSVDVMVVDVVWVVDWEVLTVVLREVVMVGEVVVDSVAHVDAVLLGVEEGQ